MTRQETINHLTRDPNITVLIVGAGINGAGLYRELALQGISTLLIDRADFSSGASAASSRMIHGGLRYLENNEVKLVKESLSERNNLLINAPHYVKPLPTTIPIFHWFSGMFNAIPKFFGATTENTARGAVLVKLGLMIYDYFTRRQQLLPSHRFTKKQEALKQRPLLNPKIVCTATYYDAWISYPERLCLELITDSLEISENGYALNYVSLVKGAANTVILQDELSGHKISMKPKIVVNATGAWIDFTNDSFGIRTDFIGGTKGSHLVIDNPALMEATDGQMLFYENKDGRICILFPFQGKVLVGSTDIKIADPDQAICSDDEVEYMLASVRQIFPDLIIDRSDIVFQFCGVRPLPNSEASITSQISRNHSIRVVPPTEQNSFPIYNLIGGKWTTFRAFAEQVTDLILAYLGKDRKESSLHLAIGGGKNYPKDQQQLSQWINDLQQKTHLPCDRINLLLKRYGTTAERVTQYLVSNTDHLLVNHPEYSRREIEYIIQNEHVAHLDDLVLRRTTLALKGELSRQLLIELADIQANLLGWSLEEKEEEIARTQKLLIVKHRLNLNE